MRGTGQSSRGRLFSILPRSSLGTEPVPERRTPAAPSLNSATEPPGRRDPVLSHQISAPPRRGSSDPRLRPTVPAQCLYPFPEASLRGRVGVGQLGPSRGPEQKQLSDFFTVPNAQHHGKCLEAGSPDRGLTRVPQRYPRLQLTRLRSRCRIFGPSQPNGAAQASLWG